MNQTLESKVWYRILKVFHIIFLVIVFTISVFLINDSYDRKFNNEKSYILCSNWDKYDLSKNSVYLYSDYIGSYDNDTFNNWCNQNNNSENTYTYRLVSIYDEKDWTSIIGYLFLELAIMYWVTQLLKLIFSYIFLGEIKFSNIITNNDGQKDCIFCGRSIQKMAKKCKYCKQRQ